MTEPNNKTNIAERILALLTLAKNAGATQAESETATRMATRLALKYQISEAEIYAASQADRDMQQTATRIRRAKEFDMLAFAVGKMFGTHNFYQWHGGWRYAFSGRKLDVALANATLEQLHARLIVGEQIDNLPVRRTYHKSDQAYVRRSWLAGASLGIYNAVLAEQAQHASETSRALMIIDNKIEAAKEWMGEMPKIKLRKSDVDAEAFNRGKKHGEQMKRREMIGSTHE